jgi:hypothetical protein
MHSSLHYISYSWLVIGCYGEQKLINYPEFSLDLDDTPEEEDGMDDIQSSSDAEWVNKEEHLPVRAKPAEVKKKPTMSDKGKEVRLCVTAHHVDPEPHSKRKADIHTSPKKVSVAFAFFVRH